MVNYPDTAIYSAYDDFKGLDPSESEKNLMRAILKTAMEDMNRNGEARRDAKLFFISNEDIYLFSFISICHHLDLCPFTIRELVGVRVRPDVKHRVVLDNKLMAA